MTIRLAVINAGKVENTILASPGFTVPGKLLVESDDANIADLWDGVKFSKPVLTADEIAKITRDAILSQIASRESSITPRRMREATLTEAGRTWLASVDSDIAKLREKLYTVQSSQLTKRADHEHEP